jgi:hypothetical protein
LSQYRSRAGAGWPAFFCLILAVLLAAGCYSSNYDHEMTANLQLISDMCDKLADYCRHDFRIGDHIVTAEEMGEFYYAYNKASAFSASTPRESSLNSHKDFNTMLAAYENFVHAADEYRLKSAPDPATLALLVSQCDQVKHIAGRVAQDLHTESK